MSAPDLDLDAIERRCETAHADAVELMIPDEMYDAGLTIPEACALLAEVRRLRAALAYYADEDNWTRSSFDLLDWYSAGPPGSNGVDVARATLAEG